MDKRRDPFAGVKLSEAVPAYSQPPGRDQRLFGPTPLPVATSEALPEPSTTTDAPQNLGTKEARDIGSKEPRKQPSKFPRNQVSKELRSSTAAETSSRWHIKQRPNHRMTFDFTDEELDALDDLKREARRRYELKTTKQDLVRHAIHELLRDYEENGEASWILAKLRDQ
jgi:hypothetical protein